MHALNALREAGLAAAAAQQLLRQQAARHASALAGNRSPLDVGRNNNPQMEQPTSMQSTEDAFELRVPGVVGMGVEPNVPRPGTVDVPNPSEKLLEKQPIAKVTHDGDVTARSIPEAPGESMPRN